MAAIQAISAVPTILETVAVTTGLGFVCIARVTQDSWTTCAVLDKLDFGLNVGDGLDVTTTLCEEVRDTGKAIIIDCVSTDGAYHDHHTPRIYGFESYISIPIFRQNGDYFGTLCGLDPKPATLSTPAITSSMTLFAQLISLQMEADAQLTDTRGLLADERETAELREQFIAVLGHDLRTPLGSILMAVEVAKRKEPDSGMRALLDHIGRSAHRISALVDDVVDFTRGRMGGGIALELRREYNLHLAFEQVIEELRGVHPERTINAQLQPIALLLCDRGRMSQMLSNLLNNALVHGDPALPVEVTASEANDVFQLTVTNAGPRIPDEVRRQLFKPFWRGSVKVAREGLGLGLFIVSEIARSHGGRIDVVTSDKATSFIYKVRRMDFAALSG
ncbi:sensor histidine kinase [Massilia aerilata]|uniref:histidine kinase n=1 Tax=Massilia aerilata TaxID=453817 RepID=A0ABW0S0W1_9BURK